MCLCNAEVKVQDDIWINKIPTACDRRPLCTHVCVCVHLSVPVPACELDAKLGNMGKHDGFVDEDYIVLTVHSYVGGVLQLEIKVTPSAR